MRLIDADEVLSKIDKHHRSEPTEPYSLNDYDKGVNWGLDIATDIVFSAPTVEKRGRWVEASTDGAVFCSECGTEWLSEAARYYNFCPICGARMGAETDGTN